MPSLPRAHDYAPRKPRRLDRRLGFATALLLGLGSFLYVVTFCNYLVRRNYVCTTCGVFFSEDCWFGFWRTHREQPSSVSAVLVRYPAVPRHDHSGVFLNENGWTLLGGWYCALGNGSNVLSASGDFRAAALLDNLYIWGYRADADMWRGRLLDPASARRCEHVIEDLSVTVSDSPVELRPEDEFKKWWALHGPELEEIWRSPGPSPPSGP